jgi:hypothetical protein
MYVADPVKAMKPKAKVQINPYIYLLEDIKTFKDIKQISFHDFILNTIL